MNICIYGSSSDLIDRIYLNEAERLGFAIARHGHTLIYGAGGEGVMGAAARGVMSAGGSLVGVVPSFLDLGGNLFEQCTELIRTDNMRERKARMEELSDAFIVMPGGLGTFDEFFEILTLKQLGRHGKAVALYNIGGYFDDIAQMLEKAIAHRFMKENCRSLYRFFGDRDSLLDYIESYQAHVVDILDMKHVR